jgi:metal-responsive CopG/Arc/MetJ family transcriptional regulator
VGITCVRLPDALTNRLDQLAIERDTSRSALIREAVERFCDDAQAEARLDRAALVERLVTYPGSGRGDLAENGERILREHFDARRRRRPG